MAALAGCTPPPPPPAAARANLHRSPDGEDEYDSWLWKKITGKSQARTSAACPADTPQNRGDAPPGNNLPPGGIVPQNQVGNAPQYQGGNSPPYQGGNVPPNQGAYAQPYYQNGNAMPYQGGYGAPYQGSLPQQGASPYPPQAPQPGNLPYQTGVPQGSTMPYQAVAQQPTAMPAPQNMPQYYPNVPPVANPAAPGVYPPPNYWPTAPAGQPNGYYPPPNVLPPSNPVVPPGMAGPAATYYDPRLSPQSQVPQPQGGPPVNTANNAAAPVWPASQPPR